ncbi:MAG: HindVP family restriction endonuclease, partial [Roseburia sp.]|nr:HindVP family restriction endonuclease [Roseburia sp.]
DLVIKDLKGNFLSPLEVKLTVLPDNTTYKREEKLWGSELVVRSATTLYCALGMFDAVKDDAKKVREIFEDACSSIQGWDNDFEMTHKLVTLAESIDVFQSKYYQKQKPLLMQTLWKTQGKSPLLANQAFDIVIWSDYAFGNQTDKEFAIPGNKWRNYVETPRTASPILSKNVVNEIIKNGYIEKLSPERRFDQTLYFTVRNQL